MREVLPDGDELAQDSLQEHQQAKQVLSDLDAMSPDDPEFDQRVGRLIEDIQHHVEEEEGEMFSQAVPAAVGLATHAASICSWGRASTAGPLAIAGASGAWP